MKEPSPQRRALPRLIAEITAIDPDCGIVLQGSVQHGVETPTSDIDLLVAFSDGATANLTEHWLIQPDKKGVMIRAADPESGLNVDLIWFVASELKAMLQKHGASNYYIFANGEMVTDRAGLAADCQNVARMYFERHPAVADAWRVQNAEVRRHKADPQHALKYPRWPDFSVYLTTLE